MAYRRINEFRVLVVDDQKVQRDIIAELIQSNQPDTHIERFGSAAEVLDYAKTEQVDLLVTDFRMPGMDGIELIHLFRQIPDMEQVPICMITSAEDPVVPVEALTVGATDFLKKPVNPLEAQVRIANLLSIREQQLLLLERNKFLEDMYVKKDVAQKMLKRVALRMMSRIGEYRDNETGKHLNRMARYSYLIAQALGFPENRCNLIREAAPLHDIGKVGISDEILLKPGKLTPSEWEIMKTHTTRGFEMLRSRPDDSTDQINANESVMDSDWDIARLDWAEAQMGAVIARAHHEKYDGTGYPDRLHGEEIPMEARIIAVADVFDALTSVRPYKRAWTFYEAKEYIMRERGKHLDPQCVDAFLGRPRQVEQIYKEYADTKDAANDPGHDDHSNIVRL